MFLTIKLYLHLNCMLMFNLQISISWKSVQEIVRKKKGMIYGKEKTPQKEQKKVNT